MTNKGVPPPHLISRLYHLPSCIVLLFNFFNVNIKKLYNMLCHAPFLLSKLHSHHSKTFIADSSRKLLET